MRRKTEKTAKIALICGLTVVAVPFSRIARSAETRVEDPCPAFYATEGLTEAAEAKLPAVVDTPAFQAAARALPQGTAELRARILKELFVDAPIFFPPAGSPRSGPDDFWTIMVTADSRLDPDAQFKNQYRDLAKNSAAYLERARKEYPRAYRELAESYLNQVLKHSLDGPGSLAIVPEEQRERIRAALTALETDPSQRESALQLIEAGLVEYAKQRASARGWSRLTRIFLSRPRALRRSLKAAVNPSLTVEQAWSKWQALDAELRDGAQANDDELRLVNASAILGALQSDDLASHKVFKKILRKKSPLRTDLAAFLREIDSRDGMIRQVRTALEGIRSESDVPAAGSAVIEQLLSLADRIGANLMRVKEAAVRFDQANEPSPGSIRTKIDQKIHSIVRNSPGAMPMNAPGLVSEINDFVDRQLPVITSDNATHLLRELTSERLNSLFPEGSDKYSFLNPKLREALLIRMMPKIPELSVARLKELLSSAAIPQPRATVFGYAKSRRRLSKDEARELFALSEASWSRPFEASEGDAVLDILEKVPDLKASELAEVLPRHAVTENVMERLLKRFPEMPVPAFTGLIRGVDKDRARRLLFAYSARFPELSKGDAELLMKTGCGVLIYCRHDDAPGIIALLQKTRGLVAQDLPALLPKIEPYHEIAMALLDRFATVPIGVAKDLLRHADRNGEDLDLLEKLLPKIPDLAAADLYEQLKDIQRMTPWHAEPVARVKAGDRLRAVAKAGLSHVAIADPESTIAFMRESGLGPRRMIAAELLPKIPGFSASQLDHLLVGVQMLPQGMYDLLEIFEIGLDSVKVTDGPGMLRLYHRVMPEGSSPPQTITLDAIRNGLRALTQKSK